MRAEVPIRPQNASSNSLFSYNGQQWALKYDYDLASSLTARTDTRWTGTEFVEVSYEYDVLNRVKVRSYNDGTAQVSYNYDTAANGVGRLASVVTSGVTTYNYSAYDAMGRVTAYNQQTEGQTYQMENSYNKGGLMVTQKYPSGKVVTTEYNNAARIVGVKKEGAGYYAGAAARDSVNRMPYTAAGGVSAMRLGNNLWEHTNYNSRLQPTQIGLGTASTNSSLLGLDYSYSTTSNT